MRGIHLSAATVALVLLGLAAGCTDKVTDPKPSQYFYSSFETSQGGQLEGWIAHASDIDNVNWSITRTLDKAKDGLYSVRMSLNNTSGKGKIWIQRVCAVDTSVDYHVSVSYQFATSDFGTTGFWTIITGALPYAVESSGELTYKDETRNGRSSDVGHVWLGKSYEFDLRSSPAGQVFVQIGVRGNGEGSRTYYLDSVNITFTKK